MAKGAGKSSATVVIEVMMDKGVVEESKAATVIDPSAMAWARITSAKRPKGG